MLRTLLFAGVVLTAVSMAAPIFAQEHTAHAASPAAKYGPVPGLPGCLTAAPQHGDPGKEAFVVLAKATTGCKIPWHWHTGMEQLMFVAGKARVEMKDPASSSMMMAGDYIYLPAKHVHQFTCLGACKFFIESDRAFDIHYVDAAGKEIPQEEALKPVKRLAKQ
jgi:quercetin dioxygenase-like cupin family protein